MTEREVCLREEPWHSRSGPPEHFLFLHFVLCVGSGAWSLCQDAAAWQGLRKSNSDASWGGALGGPETLRLLYGQERLTGCVPGGVGMDNPERSMIGGGGLTLRKWDSH